MAGKAGYYYSGHRLAARSALRASAIGHRPHPGHQQTARNPAIHHFHYRDESLYCEDVPLARIAAEVGTPCYVYSQATLSRHYRVFAEGLSEIPHLICYAMKANSSQAILKLLLNLGAGFDIVSGGELYRALAAGADPARIVFSGVGKNAAEIAAALEAGILMFNVESEGELRQIARVATDMGRRAPVSLRVNPDIDPRTHPYIATGLSQSKFGIEIATARQLFAWARQQPSLEVVGIDCHIGSQITELEPFLEAFERVREMVLELKVQGLPIRYLDLGGGLGIPYHDETPPEPREYTQALAQRAADLGCTLVFEPGRVLVGNAGILLTRVEYLKQGSSKHFVIADTGMHHLIRPALYDAWQGIQAVNPRSGEPVRGDLVGPICESGDFLAKDRMLPPLEPGDLLAIMSAGAYGFSMASNYNSYPRPAEVLVNADKYAVVHQRERYEDLVRGESLPDWL
ncbi:MAG TPA: diaminopimelate decarboxylase [Candidatus Obscuribacterales bacterium]